MDYLKTAIAGAIVFLCFKTVLDRLYHGFQRRNFDEEDYTD